MLQFLAQDACPMAAGPNPSATKLKVYCKKIRRSAQLIDECAAFFLYSPRSKTCFAASTDYLVRRPGNVLLLRVRVRCAPLRCGRTAKRRIMSWTCAVPKQPSSGSTPIDVRSVAELRAPHDEGSGPEAYFARTGEMAPPAT